MNPNLQKKDDRSRMVGEPQNREVNIQDEMIGGPEDLKPQPEIQAEGKLNRLSHASDFILGHRQHLGRKPESETPLYGQLKPVGTNEASDFQLGES